MEDVEVLAYKGFVLRRSDLDVLKGQCYLSDEIIGFYFSYLSSSFGSDEILLLPPSVSFCLANSEDVSIAKDFVKTLKFESKQLIVFPINDVNGTHWSVLVYDRFANTFYHHDTIKGANNSSAMDLFDKVKEFIGFANKAASSKKKKAVNKSKKCKEVTPTMTQSAVPKFVEVDTVQQMNDYDCGIYVMAIAKAICQWHGDDWKDKSWIKAVEENVSSSVEFTMRPEVIKVIEELKGSKGLRM